MEAQRLAGLALLAAWPAGAAPITFDFTASGGVVNGSGHGLTRRYTAGGLTLTVSGFSLTASGGTFTQASVGQYGGAGLGVCNASEGLHCSAHYTGGTSQALVPPVSFTNSQRPSASSTIPSVSN